MPPGFINRWFTFREVVSVDTKDIWLSVFLGKPLPEFADRRDRKAIADAMMIDLVLYIGR